VTIEIRVLRSADSAVLAHVAVGVFDRPVDPRWSAEFLADPRHHLAVALADGRVVGMASAVHYVHPDKGPELWINEIGVAPTHRGGGLGGRLLQALFDCARELGCTEAWVLANHSNHAARRLYEAVGGTETPIAQVMYSFALNQAPRVMIYDSAAAIPPTLEAQIRRLLHAEWPGTEDVAALPLIDPGLHPVHFVLAEGDQVVSYTRTIRATISHRGQVFMLYGLGDVVTRPGQRQRGYGGRLVEAATAHIRRDPAADAAVLLTEPALEQFYQRYGWEHVAGLRVTTGDSDQGTPFAMILFISAKVRAARERFADDPLVLTGDEW
jgi:aminoglycoside 6'-N-acetyltransferase I